MKGKRYTTEYKIRLLGAADRGEKIIQDICREENVSEVTLQRWKKQFPNRSYTICHYPFTLPALFHAILALFTAQFTAHPRLV